MYIKGKNEVIDNFIEKCKKDMQILKDKMFNALNNGNGVRNDYINIAYKMTMYDEMLDYFLCNGAEVGIGYYARLYGDLENPLQQIYKDMITEFTEPKLLTKNKMYKLLDKKGV